MLTNHRLNLDMPKVDHFVDSLNRPYFYQDVGLWNEKVKIRQWRNRLTLSIPNIVRTVARSNMIMQYHHHSKSIEYEPLSKRTLYRILEWREANQRN